MVFAQQYLSRLQVMLQLMWMLPLRYKARNLRIFSGEIGRVRWDPAVQGLGTFRGDFATRYAAPWRNHGEIMSQNGAYDFRLGMTWIFFWEWVDRG